MYDYGFLFTGTRSALVLPQLVHLISLRCKSSHVYEERAHPVLHTDPSFAVALRHTKSFEIRLQSPKNSDRGDRTACFSVVSAMNIDLLLSRPVSV